MWKICTRDGQGDSRTLLRNDLHSVDAANYHELTMHHLAQGKRWSLGLSQLLRLPAVLLHRNLASLPEVFRGSLKEYEKYPLTSLVLKFLCLIQSADRHDKSGSDNGLSTVDVHPASNVFK